MAFMAMRKNLDERQRKKNFDEIFKKFDHNHNQRVAIREFTEVVPKFECVNNEKQPKRSESVECLFSRLSLQEISEELEVQFDQKEIELLQKLAGEDGLVV